MNPHNTYAETTIEIEGHEIDVRLELEYVPGYTPPKDHIGRHVEPVETPGYIIIGAEWKSPFDDPSDWEPVPGVVMGIIHKNERELLERADVEVAV